MESADGARRPASSPWAATIRSARSCPSTSARSSCRAPSRGWSSNPRGAGAADGPAQHARRRRQARGQDHGDGAAPAAAAARAVLGRGARPARRPGQCRRAWCATRCAETAQPLVAVARVGAALDGAAFAPLACPGRMRVAFVLKGYPRLSETFIAQEIRALERRGLAIEIVVAAPADRRQAPSGARRDRGAGPLSAGISARRAAARMAGVAARAAPARLSRGAA